MKHQIQKLRGFTLIELLIVIAIIVILAAIVLVAINPAKQIATANNTQRSSSATAILNAVSTFLVDKNGVLPAAIPAGHAACGAAYATLAAMQAAIPAANRITADNASLTTDLVPGIIAATPKDSQGTVAGADFTICQSVTNSRVTVYADLSQVAYLSPSQLIHVTR